MKQADDADQLTASLDDDGKHSVASSESALHILPKGVGFRTIPELHIECNGCEIITHCDDIWFNGRIFPDYARLPAIWGFYTKNIKRFNFSEQPSGDFCARCAKTADRFYSSRAVVSAKLKGDEITFKEDWEENKESVNKDLKNNVRDGQGFQLSKLPRREISEKTKQFSDCKQDGFGSRFLNTISEKSEHRKRMVIRLCHSQTRGHTNSKSMPSFQMMWMHH